MCDTESGEEYTDLIEMHVLELSKLPPEQQNETDLMKWMRFFGGTCEEDFKKMAEKETKVIFGGRLGEYKYYDMDKVTASALRLVESEFGK